ncbi:MAG: hypothetical protein JST80_02540 [Bdellovibrionales bacterium]|nr:hypothetical protein [Bdellovibrionales bacterium]
MDKIAEKIVPLAAAFVIGLMTQHPLTWRMELKRVQYSMLRELSRTDNWGTPSPWAHVKRR